MCRHEILREALKRYVRRIMSRKGRSYYRKEEEEGKKAESKHKWYKSGYKLERVMQLS